MSLERIARARSIIERGGIIGFPTDTVYGIGGDFRRPQTVDRLYASKGRARDKALIILGADIAAFEPFLASAASAAREAALRFWPGAVTFIVPRPACVPEFVTAGAPTVGLRVPGLAFAQQLLQATGPLATTSANLSGAPAYDGRSIAVLPEVDEFIEDGPSPVGCASTIIDLSVEPPRLLREGGLAWHGFQAWYATLR